MQELIHQVIQWANDRNLIKGSNPDQQGLKLMSEYGELCESIAKGNHDGIKDGIGDILVVLIIICEQVGKNFDDDYIAEYDHNNIFYLSAFLAKFIVEKGDKKTITDILALLNSIATQHQLTLQECLAHAFIATSNLQPVEI